MRYPILAARTLLTLAAGGLAGLAGYLLLLTGAALAGKQTPPPAAAPRCSICRAAFAPRQVYFFSVCCLRMLQKRGLRFSRNAAGPSFASASSNQFGYMRLEMIPISS